MSSRIKYCNNDNIAYSAGSLVSDIVRTCVWVSMPSGDKTRIILYVHWMEYDNNETGRLDRTKRKHSVKQGESDGD